MEIVFQDTDVGLLLILCELRDNWRGGVIYIPCQSQEAGADVALREEYQSRTKAKHGLQSKIFPA